VLGKRQFAHATATATHNIGSMRNLRLMDGRELLRGLKATK
jgi:hypothetical protein